MNLDDIDRALAAWHQQLSSAAQNLMDLHSQPTYQRLTGNNGIPKAELTGMTAARVRPLLDAMGTLFQHFDALRQTIDRAAEIRKNISPIFGSEQKSREIENLLAGKSVRLPSVKIPLEQRSLLSAVENLEWISPGELMQALARSFGAARDAVLAVDSAWETLGMKVGQAEATITGFKAQATKWNVADAQLNQAEAMIAKIRARAETDPLAAVADYESAVAPVIAQAETALRRIRLQVEQIASSLAKGRSSIQELEQTHLQALTACQQRREKVLTADEPTAPQPEEKLEALREWLNRLEAKFQTGMLDPIAVGLDKWNKAAADCVSLEREALAKNRELLDLRSELRGRLDALKAKARARGLAELPAFMDLSEQAEQLLYSRPTPLDKAMDLVSEYEIQLNVNSPARKES